MAAGEITVTCPNCQHRTNLPIAAVKRDNFYCGKCFEKVPLARLPAASFSEASFAQPARPKKSSRTHRR